MHELWCEIFCEELPALEQRLGLISIEKKIQCFFDNMAIYKINNLEALISPRRIAFCVEVFEADAVSIEKKGPSIQATEFMKTGFAKSCDVSVSDLFEKDGYIYALCQQKNTTVQEVITLLMSYILQHTEWSHRMSWGAKGLWIRPIRNIVMSIDKQVIFSEEDHILKYSPITNIVQYPAQNTTDTIMTDMAGYSWQDYKKLLKENRILLNQNERQDFIQSELEAQSKNLSLKINPKDMMLLEEVTGLVEYPTVYSVSFDKKFLVLPDFLISCVIQHHLRFFLLYNDQEATNKALCVLNQVHPTIHTSALFGYERVLNARLQDALFCWNKDHEYTLEFYQDVLKKQIWFEGMGTMSDKVQRIHDVGEILLHGHEFKSLYQQAALLSKFDRATEIVKEYPQFEGVMGKIYAQYFGFETRVCEAIENHIQNKWQESKDALGIILGWVDRLDSLLGLIALKRMPSGSQDPLGLKRMAQDLLDRSCWIKKHFSIFSYQTWFHNASVFLLKKINIYRQNGVSLLNDEEILLKFNQLVDARVRIAYKDVSSDVMDHAFFLYKIMNENSVLLNPNFQNIMDVMIGLTESDKEKLVHWEKLRIRLKGLIRSVDMMSVHNIAPTNPSSDIIGKFHEVDHRVLSMIKTPLNNNDLEENILHNLFIDIDIVNDWLNAVLIFEETEVGSWRQAALVVVYARIVGV